MTCDPPERLVLLRHGESEWNKANLFTGWVDVPLSDKGREEAARGGRLLAEHGLLPDVLHTSLLRRAITTAELALAEADRQWIPVRRSWRLNERHYGALQGKDKAATLAEYGEEQFMTLAPLLQHPAAAHRARQRVLPGRRPALRRPAARGPAGDRVPRRRRRPDAAVLVRRDRAGPAQRRDGAGRRARQQPAGAGQAPRRHGGRRGGRAEHPDRRPAALRPGRRPATAEDRRASTSTPTPRPPRSRRSRTRARSSGQLARLGAPGVSPVTR